MTEWQQVELLQSLMLFIIVAIPVLGFTIRFAINPLLKSLLQLREASAKQSADADGRLIQLTGELQRLSAVVERLEEASEFERELRTSSLPKGSQRG